MEVELREIMDHVVHKRSVGVKLAYVSDAVFITPVGYSARDGRGCKDQSMIMLEVHDGRLELVVWADIESEEPTHIISLEGARNV